VKKAKGGGRQQGVKEIEIGEHKPFGEQVGARKKGPCELKLNGPHVPSPERKDRSRGFPWREEKKTGERGGGGEPNVQYIRKNKRSMNRKIGKNRPQSGELEKEEAEERMKMERERKRKGGGRPSEKRVTEFDNTEKKKCLGKPHGRKKNCRTATKQMDYEKCERNLVINTKGTKKREGECNLKREKRKIREERRGWFNIQNIANHKQSNQRRKNLVPMTETRREKKGRREENTVNSRGTQNRFNDLKKRETLDSVRRCFQKERER